MHIAYNIINKFSLLLATEGLPEPSIISFDMELIKSLVFIWINVIVLIIILALVLYKPVRNFMDKRKEGIQSDLDFAASSRREADELKQECERQLRDIEKEREKILVGANKKAMERSEAIIKEAREEAESIRKHTMNELAEERTAMEGEIKRQLIELSVMLAERFVSVSMDEAEQDRYVEQALANWEERLWLDT